MARSTHITFRGIEDVDVEFIDHGYEPDTNAHEIEWWFARPKEVGGDVTPEEEDAVLGHLYEIVCDPHYYDESDLRD
jgi:hypothetical protein